MLLIVQKIIRPSLVFEYLHFLAIRLLTLCVFRTDDELLYSSI